MRRSSRLLRLQRVWRSTGALAACVVVFGCGGGPAAATGASIDGVILTIDNFSPRQVTVRETSSQQRRVLLVHPNTAITRQGEGQAQEPTGVESLVPGARILGWHTGTEYRSDPPQYDATLIVLLREQ